MHPDTLGEHSSGKSFPRSDIADRLCELTDIECLKSDVGDNSSTEMVSQERPAAPLILHPLNVPSREEPQESVTTGASGQPQEESHPGKSPEVITEQQPRELPPKEGRREERSERVKGYRVKVQYQPVAEGEKQARREAVGQVILQALRRLKDKEPTECKIHRNGDEESRSRRSPSALRLC